MSNYAGTFTDITSYLEVPDRNELDLEIQTHCIECYINHNIPSGKTEPSGIVAKRGPSSGDTSFWFALAGGGTSAVIYYAGWYAGGQANAATGVTSIFPGLWTHVAMTRTGGSSPGVIRLFVNGKLEAVINEVAPPIVNTNSLKIGRIDAFISRGRWFTGKISNLRITSGSIPTLYNTTSTTIGQQIFTPPNSALTNEPGTSLLTLQSPLHIDNSSLGNTVTEQGSVPLATDSTLFSTSPTYSIVPSVTAVNEGGTVTWNIQTAYFGTGTLYYTNEGTTSSFDFIGFSDSGSVSIVNDVGSFSLQLDNDFSTEGGETIQMFLRTGSVTGPVVALSAEVGVADSSISPVTYSISPTITTVSEGGTVTWNITTTGFGSGFLYYTNGGSTVASDFTDNANDGAVYIFNDVGSFSKTLTNDGISEGSQTISMSLRTGSVTGSIVDSSPTVTVLDTSTSISSPQPLVTTLSQPTVVLDQYQSTSIFPVLASGGSGALTFSIAPSLPFGLTLDSATGRIFGNPSVPLSATNFTVTVTDSSPSPQTDSEVFNLTVNAGVTPPPISNPDNKILATDYNSIGQTVVSVLGNGVGSRGYGNVTLATAVTDIDKVSPTEWNTLRYDLLNARAHQIGSNPALAVIASTGTSITEDDKVTFANLANTIDSDRFTAHSSRLITRSLISSSRTTSWASKVEFYYQQTFNNVVGPVTSAERARFWYNQGGRINFTSSRTGGASTLQNNAWTTLLSSINYTFDASQFYNPTLGTSYTRLYTAVSSAPYSSNVFYIDALCDVSNNNSGGAAVITFRVTWSDGYIDPSPGNLPLPEDIVDGTLTINISETYASGEFSMVPSGTFRNFSQVDPLSGPLYDGYYLYPSYQTPSGFPGTITGS